MRWLHVVAVESVGSHQPGTDPLSGPQLSQLPTFAEASKSEKDGKQQTLVGFGSDESSSVRNPTDIQTAKWERSVHPDAVSLHSASYGDSVLVRQSVRLLAVRLPVDFLLAGGLVPYHQQLLSTWRASALLD